VGPFSAKKKETEGKKEGGVSGVLLGCCFGPAQVAEILPFFYSGSFSFCFLFCFISFVFSLQTYSNKFVNFCKIQSIKVGQSKTSFQNKIRFSI
jgi:hypothetical protein